MLLDGLAVSSAEVPEGAEVGLELTLEATGDDLVVSGVVRVPWSGTCRRCLAEVQAEVDADVREIFQRVPVEGDTYPLGDGMVDLEPMVREAVLLALPLAPLCSEDCVGPDPERFPAKPEGGVGSAAGDGPDDGAPRRDPRWAVLDELRFDDDDT